MAFGLLPIVPVLVALKFPLFVTVFPGLTVMLPDGQFTVANRLKTLMPVSRTGLVVPP